MRVVTKNGVVERKSGTEIPLSVTTDFLREVRGLALGRSHLNPFFGSESLKRKKLCGERLARYDEVLNAIRIARREGNRKGSYGSHLAAAIVNAVIADSIDDGQFPDVIALPIDPATAALLKAPVIEEVEWARAHADLHDEIADATRDGGIDEKDRGRIQQRRALETKEFSDVVRAYGVRR